ncbi:MAG TPA: Gfo/Idh/MocA family oxidoreductase [Ferruginibacter sp.]|jgi:predicted dehydrogenase|nr:Gfo/Idh/MocA family oxidoreductase [Ferruginibacter sp.]
MHQINWGIIGCGDVTEIKSGPAFDLVQQSRLVAVMRRNAVKAEDYATRHNVPRWYTDAQALINDQEVNAIYIATPPSSHEQYTIAAIEAGKPVYVEKPMSVHAEPAARMAALARSKNVKLVVAHYRREWPLFKKLKSLVSEKKIGEIRLVRLQYAKTPFSETELADEKIAWRVNPGISGGGIFHDLAPHQLDIFYYLFGPAKKISGIAVNQAGLYDADDLVAGNILFENNVAFNGTWFFNANTPIDQCEIIGSTGKIRFSFFNDHRIELIVNNTSTVFDFDALKHVQQPMIESTVRYFLGKGENPCSGEEGAEVMRWITAFTK